jgi:hypothetical protein
MPWYNMTVSCKACEKYLEYDEPFFDDCQFQQGAYHIVLLELLKELSIIPCIGPVTHDFKIMTIYQQNPPYHEPAQYKILREANKLIDEIIDSTPTV